MAEPSRDKEREKIFVTPVQCTVTICALYVLMTEYLEGLDEGPQQNADGLALSQQLDETSCSEEPQEAQVDEVILQYRGKPQSATLNTRHLHNLPLPNIKIKNNSGTKRG